MVKDVMKQYRESGAFLKFIGFLDLALYSFSEKPLTGGIAIGATFVAAGYASDAVFYFKGYCNERLALLEQQVQQARRQADASEQTAKGLQNALASTKSLETRLGALENSCREILGDHISETDEDVQPAKDIPRYDVER